MISDDLPVPRAPVSNTLFAGDLRTNCRVFCSISPFWRSILQRSSSDNETYKHTSDGEIHPGEVVEEKISLSERFGLWVSFYPFKQDDYLTIVGHWLKHFGCEAEEIAGARGDALVWALERGSRSGRVAWQFARDWSGRKA